MKKIIFGIFAHPDDEAFGPSGTLLKLRSEGYDIHLILLTDGDAGQNIDNVADLAATRLAEWQNAATLLGASSTHALHYPDGKLDDMPVETLETSVRPILDTILTTYAQPPEVSFVTLEPNGLTGHLDHIAASKLTLELAQQLTAHEIWYFCLDSSQAPLENTAYYEPRAREDSYITARIDVAPWLETKHRIMDAHYSQRSDAEMMKALGTSESFHVEILN